MLVNVFIFPTNNGESKSPKMLLKFNVDSSFSPLFVYILVTFTCCCIPILYYQPQTHQSHLLEIMLSGNKRPRDADAIEDKELSKRPTTEANVAAENPVSNQQKSPKVEGDESWYYQLEAALEQEEDEKEKEEAKDQEEGKEEAEGSHAEVIQGRRSTVAEEHWKENAAIRKLEKKKWIKNNDESEEDECLEKL